MAQKIVVCCDGTWNTPRSNTNIFRTYSFLRDRLAHPVEAFRGEGIQVCRGQARDGTAITLFYDQGVGTNFFERLIGGAAGAGLSENVCQAYHFLAHEFNPGAEIYIFGFSRGAYTARSLCGFIQATNGLLQRPSIGDVRRAYFDDYVTEDRIIARPPGWSWDRARAQLMESAGNLVGRFFGTNLRRAPRYDDVRIRFVGVYDTVGALGIPLSKATRVNTVIVGFHDTTISNMIEHAVHALAVDERRGPYMPALWTLEVGQALEPGQTVLQVWFPGVHSDIGGGYRDRGIGAHTLHFMLRQAARYGLVLDEAPTVPAETLEPLPAQHESFDAAWRKVSEDLDFIPAGQRSIGTTMLGPAAQTLQVAGEVRFHPLLAERFGKRVDVILDEHKETRQIQEYSPLNASSGLLPLFVDTVV
jgi:uncharacterized protein (DUF2235 family)